MSGLIAGLARQLLGPRRGALAAAGGYPLFMSDRNICIGMTTDGEQLWVEVEKR